MRALPYPEKERHGSVNNCWSCILGNLVVRSVKYSHKQSIGCLYCQKNQTKGYLLHLENARQQSLSDFGSRIIGNMSGA
jgi:hypothetical protein